MAQLPPPLRRCLRIPSQPPPLATTLPQRCHADALLHSHRRKMIRRNPAPTKTLLSSSNGSSSSSVFSRSHSHLLNLQQQLPLSPQQHARVDRTAAVGMRHL